MYRNRSEVIWFWDKKQGVSDGLIKWDSETSDKLCYDFRGYEGSWDWKTDRMGYVIIEKDLKSLHQLRKLSESKCMSEGVVLMYTK